MEWVLAVLKALPVLDDWFQKLMAAYVQARIGSMKSENRDAIRKVIVEHDQRAIEEAMGSPTAGKVSGDAGAVIVDGPPPNVLP